MEIKNMSDLTCYRIMQDSEKSWKPYKSEPMYDDHPDMGSYRSTYGIGMPKSGDYLIKEQDGISVRSADRGFENVRFSAMPSVDELINSGIVVQVSKQIMEQDLAQQDQLQSLTDQIEVLQQHLEDGKDYIVELRSESASDQRSENMRNAFAEIEKTQAEIAELEGQLLNLEKEYQKFSEENFFRQDIENRRFLSEDAWGSTTPPHNAADLIAAFDRKMNEFIRTADLDPRCAEDQIQNHADQLWDQYCETDEIDGVRSQWEPKLKQPSQEKGGKSLAELMKSAQNYAETHAQPVQLKTMVENRGKTR